ncbi:MAG TPA: cation diffusion facilitator family transporter [Zoogloea sp.]|uniref:cation diffusion facilitator family transporter n=1 Tax=Zoogloea sp. TaxID=49181 RepID=UPI002B7C1973|nr:cation diffusion facilitator family transporter [Zoogloea sp.]HMY48505.1 cation diffusion facilitator family transporter [Rhodocyclaceae bacterium]HNH15578.1 cation diffusion facilitator family transporter [Zoogloea sp.]HNI46749.1 cation diffusion facilitator family transporter [Zoogloea sp.]
MTDRQPHHYAWLSIAAALFTIAFKALAWWLTGSVGLLSDALESFVNLAGACFALWMILVTRLPPDRGHPFGHGKAEYFSSGFEGILILGAALAIIAAAAERLLQPQPLESPGWGLVWSGVATAINFGVARTLARAGRQFNSIALQADARHLMTDVWTSVGVILGVGLVAATGWLRLDPLIALAVGAQIVVEAVRLLRESIDGLMDRSLDGDALNRAEAALAPFRQRGIAFTALRTRRAGASAFVQVTVRVPGDWSVRSGHACLDEVEAALRTALPGAEVITHLEPLS